MSKKLNLYQLIITVVAVLFASALVVYGWTAPTGAPPGNDVSPPINTGSTGQIKEGGLSVANTPTISNIGFRVITGNLAIGSSSTAVSKSGIFDGFINASDVWVRDANGGAGAWASALGGGGGGTSNLGQGTVPAPYGANSSCYWVNPNLTRWHYDVCSPGYMVRGIDFQADGNWDNGNTLCCKIDLSSPTYCSNGTQPGQSTYGVWGACSAVLPDVCAGQGCWSGQVYGTAYGTETRTVTTCQADGTLSYSTQSQACSVSGWYCADINFCSGFGGA